MGCKTRIFMCQHFLYSNMCGTLKSRYFKANYVGNDGNYVGVWPALLHWDKSSYTRCRFKVKSISGQLWCWS